MSSMAIEAIKDNLVFDLLCDQPATLFDRFSGEPVETESPRNTGEWREGGMSRPTASESFLAALEPLEMLSRESQPPAKKNTRVIADTFSHNPGKPL